MKAINVAEHILLYAKQNNLVITNNKLQKILYYLQGYYLYMFSRPLFVESIYRWDYGASVPDVFFNYSLYNGNLALIKLNCPQYFFNPRQKKLFKTVIEECFNFSTKDLIKMNLDDYICQNSQQNSIISISDIQNYFDNNDPLNIKNKL